MIHFKKAIFFAFLCVAGSAVASLINAQASSAAEKGKNNLDGMRIVLTWSDKPWNLDAHLFYPGNHVYFNAMTGDGASLDVNDTNGYGPETITINRRRHGQRYIYAVHDYASKYESNWRVLISSKAKVFVYVGDKLIKSYAVPPVGPWPEPEFMAAGNFWRVFAITESGEIEDINKLGDVPFDPASNMSNLSLGGVDGKAPQVISYYRNDPEAARELNKKGEKAYRAHNYDEAIRLYREAVELDGTYAQAFGNLGLAYQKAGHIEDAIWANNKAIGLASGESASAIRASASYNNGRIYEEAGQWSKALREYRVADMVNKSPVYANAIKRMEQKVDGK